MIPLKDDAPRLSIPWMNYLLLTVNIAVFCVELKIQALGGQHALDDFLREFGVVPERLSVLLLHNGEAPHRLASFLGSRYVGLTETLLPYFTSMFLHGGWLHLIFNMWALWIFGDNVEDHFGHGTYLGVYLFSGVMASVLHTIVALCFGPGILAPTVGASGAIAGVMGAYFVLYPSARVLTLVPFFFVFFLWLPAWIVLGLWFVMQFMSGAATTIAATSATQGGGVAFWAHVGGFIMGMMSVAAFRSKKRRYRYYGA